MTNDLDPQGISQDSSALNILREVGKALTSSLDLDHVLGVIMEMVGKLYEPGNWSLLMLDESANELYFEVVVGEAKETLKDVRIKVGEGIAGWVALNGEPVIITEAYQDPRFAKWVDEKSGFETKSIVCVPLVSKGRILGVIELLNLSASNQEMEYLTLLEALADFAAIAIENARSVQKIKELTIVDDCTGLYNARHLHTLLETEISRAIRYNTSFSLIFLDLDYFKEVNDVHGHLVGSRLLFEVGRLFKYTLRTVDWSIRYGGDEFIIILPRAGPEEAAIVARRLRNSLNEAVFFQKEGLDIRITASFGIATYPEDAMNKDDLIKLADQAMYRVKERTRNDICAAGDK
ncbi:MAG: sensor domain-containing diguanylate cyclase [bacterium]